MPTHYPHQTAKIYQFPVGGRATLGGHRKEIKPSDLNRPRVTATVAGEGWYHDAAIQDAKRTRDH